MEKVKALKSGDTITMSYKRKTISINRSDNPELFEEAGNCIDLNDQTKLLGFFLSAKNKLEAYTGGHFSLDDRDNITLKGMSQPLPSAVGKRLVQLYNDGEGMEAIEAFIKFCIKLMRNPHEHCRVQLYPFLESHKVTLCEDGDFVVEKGVFAASQYKSASMPGEMVDCYSKSMSIFFGVPVYLPEDRVNQNPTETCVQGLHCSPPAAVRKHYGSTSHVIIEVKVDPSDVRAIPPCYDNGKMRVLRYLPIGYAPKQPRAKNLVKFEDFLSTPEKGTPSYLNMPEVAHKDTATFLSSMSEEEVVAYTLNETGETVKGKNKQVLVGKAILALEAHKDGKTSQDVEKEVKEDSSLAIVDLRGMTAAEIALKIQTDYGVDIKGNAKELKKSVILDRARKLGVEKKFKVQG